MSAFSKATDKVGGSLLVSVEKVEKFFENVWLSAF
jgi:hypothetical protein